MNLVIQVRMYTILLTLLRNGNTVTESMKLQHFLNWLYFYIFSICPIDTLAMSSHIPHLACTVYCMTLKDLPAMVRLWWNSCEKRVFNIVDKFTSKYVSGILSSQEISSVQTSTQLFNGMTVCIIIFLLSRCLYVFVCISLCGMLD